MKMEARQRNVLLAVAACLLLAVGLREPEEAATAGEVKLPAAPPLAALTFDDGPRAETTRRLLDGLAAREIPATFFLIGEQVEGNEELIREMAAQGHQIGVHTYNHVKVYGLSREDYDLQVGKTRAELSAVLGPGDYWFRPPYGILDENAQKWTDTPLILWSVDPEDWKDRDTGRIVAAVTDHVEDGDIILMHDIYDSSVDAALQITDTLLDRGYCFVTVQQLLQLRGIEPQPGVRYDSAPPEDG